MRQVESYNIMAIAVTAKKITLVPLLIVASYLFFVAPPGAGPGAGERERGAGPGPRARTRSSPGPAPRSPDRSEIPAPVGDRPVPGPVGVGHVNRTPTFFLRTYVRERRSAEGVGGRTTDLQDAFLENHRSLTENGCSPGRAGDGGPKPRGWGMGAAMICLRTSSHWRQWRSTTRAA